MSPELQTNPSLTSNHRNTEHPIGELFLQRWSPRAFQPQTMPAGDLRSMLEAARWAPSAYNIQPWRFAYSLRNDRYWNSHLALLDPFNASWAKNASALVFVISDRHIANEQEDKPKLSRTHSFDTGAAWAYLALQATALGYQAHAMAGIDFAAIRPALAVPENFHIEIAIAIGKAGDAASLPAMLQEREIPSSRLVQADIASAGSFSSLLTPAAASGSTANPS